MMDLPFKPTATMRREMRYNYERGDTAESLAKGYGLPVAYFENLIKRWGQTSRERRERTLALRKARGHD